MTYRLLSRICHRLLSSMTLKKSNHHEAIYGWFLSVNFDTIKQF